MACKHVWFGNKSISNLHQSILILWNVRAYYKYMPMMLNRWCIVNSNFVVKLYLFTKFNKVIDVCTCNSVDMLRYPYKYKLYDNQWLLIITPDSVECLRRSCYTPSMDHCHIRAKQFPDYWRFRNRIHVKRFICTLNSIVCFHGRKVVIDLRDPGTSFEINFN